MTTECRPAGITPSQTVGPFFAYVLTPHDYATRPIFSNDLATADAVGERIRIEGYVLDSDGEPIVDAMIELWQPDGDGRFVTGEPQRNEGFTGFGRTSVDSNGFYGFRTVKPGQVLGPGGGLQAPHVNVGVFARGVLRRIFTRLYFADEPANEADPILALVPPTRRPTLLATPRAGTEGTTYTFNIRLQGEGETVFFEN